VEGNRLDNIESCVFRTVAIFLAFVTPLRLRTRAVCCTAILKPANIMVGPFGEVLVMDWGLAKILRAEVFERWCAKPIRKQRFREAEPTNIASDATEISVATGHGTVMGHARLYVAEQALGTWSIWTHAATSMGSANAAILALPANPNSSVPGGRRLDRSLAAICAKSTAAVPAERYPSVQEMAWMFRDTWTGCGRRPRESIFDKAGRFLTVGTGSSYC